MLMEGIRSWLRGSLWPLEQSSWASATIITTIAHGDRQKEVLMHPLRKFFAIG
jgi:hypothetical protein